MMAAVGWQWNDSQPSAEDVVDTIDRLRAYLIEHMGDAPRSIACHQWTGGFGYSMEHGTEDGRPWCRCNVYWGLGTHHDGIEYRP